MFLSKLIRRNVVQALMRPHPIIKLDPILGSSEELAQGLIRAAFSHGELEDPNKPFRVAVGRGRACPAHRELKAFFQQELPCRFGPKLLALIAVKNGVWNVKGQRFQSASDQIRPHMVLKSETENMPRPFPEPKAATDLRSICQFDLQDIRESRQKSSALRSRWP